MPPDQHTTPRDTRTGDAPVATDAQDAQDAQDARADGAQPHTPHAQAQPLERLPRWAPALLLLILGALLLLAPLSSVGIWEPWETQALQLAQEYTARPDAAPDALTGHSWAVPTHQGAPVAASLLQIWLINLAAPPSDAPITDLIGAIEWRSRAPIALATLMCALALFVTARRRLGTLGATIAGLAMLSMPAIYLGALSLASGLLAIVTTSLATLAMLAWLDAPRGRSAWIAAALAGVALSLAFLDQRLFGLMLPLLTWLGFGLSEAKVRDELPSRGALGAALAIAATAPILALGMFWGAEPGAKVPIALHTQQQLWCAGALSLLIAGALLTWRTALGKTLRTPQALLALGLPALTAAVTLIAYADVNPTLLQGGQVVGKIPALTFALEQHLFEPSFAKEHVHFDLWLRQLGFGAWPWAALAPAALIMMAISTRPQDDPRARLMRFGIIWAAVGVAVAGAASSQGHHLFLAWPAIALGLGGLLSDHDLWQRARQRPIIAYAIGFGAVAIVMMLGKDLERYPARLIELSLSFASSLKMPDGFTYGRLHKLFKYGLAITLISTCFGLVSWAALTRRAMPKLPARWRAWRAGERHPVEADPMLARAADKEALRQEDSRWGKLARAVEVTPGLSLILTAAMLVSAGLVLSVYLPRASAHYSQRHLFATYIKLAAPNEPLLRYQAPEQGGSFYLKGVPTLPSGAEFLQRYEGERFFAVVPRERLAAVNAEVRERFKRNLYVLDARSSRLVLVSNQLKSDERDESPLKDLFTTDPQPQHPLHAKGAAGAEVHPTLDGKVEVLGYDLIRNDESPQGKPDAKPRYVWGDKLTVTVYYKVLARIPSDHKIFMHVDTRGNRLHGDHEPATGALPTSAWLPGDIIKDTHTITIENASLQGDYTIYVGLYHGERRMAVQPRAAHDGTNRLSLGQIEVRAR